MGDIRPLRDRKKARTYEAMYDAALELLAEQPYDEVSIDAICERAEVGRATFFRAFGSKFGLLHEFNRRMTAGVRDAVIAAGPTRERLEVVRLAVADSWAAAGAGALELARAFARSESVRAGQDVHPELIAVVAAVIRDGQAAGDVRTDLPAALLSWYWVTGQAGVVATWLDGELGTDLAEGTAAMADMLATGLDRS